MINSSSNKELTIKGNNEGDQMIKKIIQDMISYKKEFHKKGKSFFGIDLNSKQKILLSLVQELNYMKAQNAIFKADYDYLHKKVHSFSNNKNEIKEFREMINGELKEFVDNITQFETSIMKLKKDKEINIRANEAVIANKLEEQKQFEEELNKIAFKVDKQVSLLNAVKIKKEDLEKTYNEDKEKYINDFRLQEDQYEALLNKYNFLIAKGAELREWENQRYCARINEIEQKREEEKFKEETQMYLILNIYSFIAY